MITNIVLNIFLIPKYGIQGAAIATLASQAIAAYWIDFFNPKTKKLFWMKTQTLNLKKIINDKKNI